ncbi:ATP-binding protein [Nisaea sediminum]|uniref:ATP-binding protein n=1 Tax=Nisaea sediminum TaxID=2775867 RepID=UPI001D0175CA|nr:ATP-binding protein [Nisaea sediminum]
MAEQMSKFVIAAFGFNLAVAAVICAEWSGLVSCASSTSAITLGFLGAASLAMMLLRSRARDIGSEFQRLKVSESRLGQGGSGLGMHTVFNLVVKVLEGTLQCRSEPGNGAEFEIRFPIRPPRPA